MNGVTFSLLALVLSLCVLDIDGKSGSKKGSKGGTPCFEDPTECTDRMTSGKGSQSAMAYQIWCKEGEKEKCLAGEPHSHSMDRYEEGRCDMCSFVPFFSLLFFVLVTNPRRTLHLACGCGSLSPFQALPGRCEHKHFTHARMETTLTQGIELELETTEHLSLSPICV